MIYNCNDIKHDAHYFDDIEVISITMLMEKKKLSVGDVLSLFCSLAHILACK